MQFCKSHWDELRVAISNHNLDQFISPDAEEATRRTVDSLDEGVTDQTYDPLMNAHWAIFNNALEAGGMYLLVGDYCPLCELNKYAGEGSSDKWIKYAADEQLQRALHLGLIKINS